MSDAPQSVGSGPQPVPAQVVYAPPPPPPRRPWARLLTALLLLVLFGSLFMNLVLFIVFILVLAVRPQGLVGASR